MGNKPAVDSDLNNDSGGKDLTKKVNEAVPTTKKKHKFLFLHGWRTSGHILSFQTSALRHHCNLDGTFLDAPYVATGAPDEGIAMFYTDQPYYEWITSTDPDNIQCSIGLILHALDNGHYDGLFGFSQGAMMATKVVTLLQSQGNLKGLKCVICVGGVPTSVFENTIAQPTEALQVPSLHVIGEIDPYSSECQRLAELYSPITRTVLRHSEGHRIPTLQTGIYPEIKKWLEHNVH